MRPEEAPQAFALVLAWSAWEPARVGEALVLPEEAGGVFEGGDELALVQQRPGENMTTPRLVAPGVRLDMHADARGVRVVNQGKGPMFVCGLRAESALLQAGETLEIADRLLFLCVRRPARLREAQEVHAFGGADADGFVGESLVAWELRARVAFIARRAGHVLVHGPSGTGKELLARAVHARSRRGRHRWVARNAATFPSGIIDAELFGTAANYPNAGMPERVGLVGEAEGSTLFLDEIGQLSEDLQAHLLRVLDRDGEYQRLGDPRRRTADVRFVAATNRPLEDLRPDLAARMPLRLAVPGLEDRREDVPLLVRSVLRREAATDPELAERFFEGDEPRIALPLARALLSHTYTTHVRELVAILTTALMTSPGGVAELTPEVELALAAPADAGRAESSPPLLSREIVEAALHRHGGVKDRVWRELGLPSRFALRRLLKKLGIEA